MNPYTHWPASRATRLLKRLQEAKLLATIHEQSQEQNAAAYAAYWHRQIDELTKRLEHDT